VGDTAEKPSFVREPSPPRLPRDRLGKVVQAFALWDTFGSPLRDVAVP